MTITDPIADMLTRIRNAVMAGQTLVAMPSSKIKIEIAKIMKDEGYLEGFDVADGEQSSQKVLRLKIKYMGSAASAVRSFPGSSASANPDDVFIPRSRISPGCFPVLALPSFRHPRVL